jgi:hypothetical protein
MVTSVDFECRFEGRDGCGMGAAVKQCSAAGGMDHTRLHRREHFECKYGFSFNTRRAFAVRTAIR